MNYLGTEKETSTQLAKQFQNQQKVDYERLEQEHKQTLDKIHSFESDKVKKPQDQMDVHL